MKLSIVDQSPIPSGLTAADALHNTIDLAQRAEKLGYERYWIAEHHATGALASTAPEIIIGRVAAETSTIRVGSGAVLLQHYSPLKVAETFRVLHAFYPGRIDLGIGRAPGGTPMETYALQRDRESRGKPDDFPEKLVELLAFLRGTFPEQHPFNRILVQPEMPGGPELWLLGSSAWSADAASQLGLPYAFAHFINPQPTRSAIEFYRSHYKHEDSKPRVIVAIGAIAADTDAEAQRLSSSQRARRLLREDGERGGVPTPEVALARLALAEEQGESINQGFRDNGEWPRMIAGSISSVHEQLSTMAEALDIDELMLITVVHDHQARVHSYELLAKAFGLEPRSEAELAKATAKT